MNLKTTSTEIGKRRGCLLSYSQSEPGRELTQPSPRLSAEPCTVQGSTKRQGLGWVNSLPGCSLANSHAFLPISVLVVGHLSAELNILYTKYFIAKLT